MYIPPHSSALLQPLDLGPNLVFKQHYAKLYLRDPKTDAKDNRNHQMEAAISALSVATCIGTIRPAWKKAGLWPVDIEEVKRSKMLRKPLQNLPEAKKRKRGVAFQRGDVYTMGTQMVNAANGN
jgi:hypothetical protein